MVASLRAAKLLEGVRGEKPVCVAAWKEALLRVSRLVQDFRGIREIDVNPFLLGETAEQSVAVDARIRIDPGAFRTARRSGLRDPGAPRRRADRRAAHGLGRS